MCNIMDDAHRSEGTILLKNFFNLYLYLKFPMQGYIKQTLALLSIMILPACSVFGEVSVKIAPYSVIVKEGTFEIRQYKYLLLASTPTPSGLENASAPFYKLFGYISGKNDKTEKIAMTAPVFMKQTEGVTDEMSFVLPINFSLAGAPKPNDTSVKLEEIIRFC